MGVNEFSCDAFVPHFLSTLLHEGVLWCVCWVLGCTVTKKWCVCRARFGIMCGALVILASVALLPLGAGGLVSRPAPGSEWSARDLRCGGCQGKADCIGDQGTRGTR